MNSFLQKLGIDPVIGAAALVASWGYVLYLARAAPMRIWGFALRRLTLTVEVHNTDDAFFWLERWLADHPYTARATLLKVLASPRTRIADHPKAPNEEDQATSPAIRLSPASGQHLVRHGGRWLLLQRKDRDMPGGGAGSNSMMAREMFVIRTLARSRTAVRVLLEEARDLSLPPEEPKVAVFLGMEGWWNRAGDLPRRSPESLILREGQLEDLLEDVDEFVGSKAWYRERGVPYRRGYLLHGPPGTGKTTVVHVVASVLGWDLYVLPLASLNDGHLQALMSSVPERAVVLFEDVDCAGMENRTLARTKRSQSPDGAPTAREGVTLSGLLNTLDGVIATEGRVLFLTTNARDRLDEALTRPGRADRDLRLDVANRDMACRLFARFFPDSDDLPAGVFADWWEGRPVADLQGHLLRHRGSADGAAAGAAELVAERTRKFPR